MPRIDGDPVDVRPRQGLQVNRSVDAAENPIVGLSLGPVDVLVGRFLGDIGLQHVVSPIIQQGGHVIPEPVEPALVHGSGAPAVDADLGVRHRSLEDEIDGLVLPSRRDAEVVTVQPVLRRMRTVVPVVVGAESLQFPLGRDLDGRPPVPVHSARAEKLPGDGMFRIPPRQIADLGLLPGAGESRQEEQQG